MKSGLCRLPKVASIFAISAIWAIAPVAVIAGAEGFAIAQTDEARAAARTAATQCLHALQDGKAQEAVDLCTRAESLMHAPTHLLLIARAQTKLEHLVEAQEAYIKIERDSLPSNAPKAFVDAQNAAAEERAALAPRVPTLKVTLEGADPADARLTLDGQPFPSALVGMASPIDPGSHTLQAKSASAECDPVTVTIAEGARETVTLTLKRTTPAESEAGGAAAPEADVPGRGPSSHSGMHAAGWVGLGVGVAGLAVGTVFVVKNRSDRNDASALCGANGCPESKRAQIGSFDDDATKAGTVAWIGYGFGAAGIVTGVTLLWLGRDSSAASTPVGGAPPSGPFRKVTPWIGARAAGVRVTF